MRLYICTYQSTKRVQCSHKSHDTECGKHIAWTAWTNLPDLSNTFVALTQYTNFFTLDTITMKHIERFAILMYNKRCGTVNETRHRLFTTGSKSLENTPYSQAVPACEVSSTTGEWNHATTVQHDNPDFNGERWLQTRMQRK